MIADQLHRLRLLRGWSVAELARRAGVHRSTIRKLEAGRSHPLAHIVARLAAALGVTPEQLTPPDDPLDRAGTMARLFVALPTEDQDLLLMIAHRLHAPEEGR